MVMRSEEWRVAPKRRGEARSAQASAILTTTTTDKDKQETKRPREQMIIEGSSDVRPWLGMKRDSVRPHPRGREAPGGLGPRDSEAPPRGREAPGGLDQPASDARGVPQGGGAWGFRLAHISVGLAISRVRCQPPAGNRSRTEVAPCMSRLGSPARSEVSVDAKDESATLARYPLPKYRVPWGLEVANRSDRHSFCPGIWLVSVRRYVYLRAG